MSDPFASDLICPAPRKVKFGTARLQNEVDPGKKLTQYETWHEKHEERIRKTRKRAEYGFGEYGFKHRAQ